MSENQEELYPNKPIQRQNLSLSEYVLRRNGVPLGASHSLKNMLHRSFGARTFASFWQYWNPIWGYGLGKFVYSPLKQFLPSPISLILTFGISGALHDLATMAVRRSVAFFFTPWFLLLGLGVLLGRALDMDLSKRPWSFRAAINFTYLLICLIGTLIAKRTFGFP